MNELEQMAQLLEESSEILGGHPQYSGQIRFDWIRQDGPEKFRMCAMTACLCHHLAISPLEMFNTFKSARGWTWELSAIMRKLEIRDVARVVWGAKPNPVWIRPLSVIVMIMNDGAALDMIGIARELRENCRIME